MWKHFNGVDLRIRLRGTIMVSLALGNNFSNEMHRSTNSAYITLHLDLKQSSQI